MTQRVSLQSKPLLNFSRGFFLVNKGKEMYLIFDGGNGASTEVEAYGSYRIDSCKIQRVIFGKGYTNNEAEYMTLLYALSQIILDYPANETDLEIEGDSELVRNQIGTYNEFNGLDLYTWTSWKVNEPRLLPLRNTARELLLKFRSFTYRHIPRKQVVKELGH